MYYSPRFGFTLAEVLVAISIIAILSSVVFASFTTTRQNARDTERQVSLKELQLAIEQYRAEFGRYPEQGCGGTTQWTGPGPHSSAWGNNADCPRWIEGLVPGSIDQLPVDERDDENNIGYLYRTNTSGTAYKVLVHQTVETKFVTSYDDEFARCPSSCGNAQCPNSGPQENVYAVYSRGAECW